MFLLFGPKEGFVIFFCGCLIQPVLILSSICTIIGCSYDRCVKMVLKPMLLHPARLQHVDVNCKILFKHTSCCLSLDPYPSAEFWFICFKTKSWHDLSMDSSSVIITDNPEGLSMFLKIWVSASLSHPLCQLNCSRISHSVWFYVGK